jgi:hypothetical protein
VAIFFGSLDHTWIQPKSKLFSALILCLTSSTMKKRVFCNWPCNSIFELHHTLTTHRIYTLWVLLSNKLQKLQLTKYTVQVITIQLQLCCNNFFSTTMQLPYDYNHNVMLTSFSSIHQNLTCGTMKIFHDFFEILISIIHYDYSL